MVDVGVRCLADQGRNISDTEAVPSSFLFPPSPQERHPDS